MQRKSRPASLPEGGRVARGVGDCGFEVEVWVFYLTADLHCVRGASYHCFLQSHEDVDQGPATWKELVQCVLTDRSNETMPEKPRPLCPQWELDLWVSSPALGP